MSQPLTIRDLRLHWPDAERRLKQEGELIVTRDGQPVAKLSLYRPEKRAKLRWSKERHLKWLNQAWKGSRRRRSVDDLLAEDRGA